MGLGIFSPHLCCIPPVAAWLPEASRCRRALLWRAAAVLGQAKTPPHTHRREGWGGSPHPQAAGEPRQQAGDGVEGGLGVCIPKQFQVLAQDTHLEN